MGRGSLAIGAWSVLFRGPMELLDEVYGYRAGWGFPSERDRAEITRIMAATDEAEAETEGPPETAEDGSRDDDIAGDEESSA